MKCLVCSAQTSEHRHEGVPVHVCPTGHGLWMQPEDLLIAVRTDPAAAGRTNTADEVGAILEVQEHDAEPDDDVRVCPMCIRPMGSVRYAYATSVIVDACPGHGIWLDAGELDALERWAAERYAADPRPAVPAATSPARVKRREPTASQSPDRVDESPPAGFLGWLRGRLGQGG